MNRDRAKNALNALLVVLDAAAILIAFGLAYLLRVLIPLPNPPENLGPFAEYVPLLSLQLFSILTSFFFYRLYHLGRAVSRVDQFYSVFGGVSVGALVAIAIASFVFKNNVFELDYPRAMIIYAWILCILLVTLGRVFHQW